MSVLRLLLLLGVCLAATSMAGDVSVSDTQLAELENLLVNSDLEDQELDFDDDDDDDDDDDETRMWHPITWMKNKLRNKCKCEDKLCECCFKLRVFHKKACFSAEVQEDKQIHINFKVGDRSLVNKGFDIERNSEICGRVPVSPLNFLKFCFNQKSRVDQDGTISSCSHVQFKVLHTVGAIIQFKCLQFKDGHLTFDGYKEVKKTGMLVLKAKNPFKAAVALYRKAAGKG